MKKHFALLGFIAALVWNSFLCAEPSRQALLDEAKPLRDRFAPLPKLAENPANPLTEAKIRLGKLLYFDPRISKNHDVSCNTCHLLDRYGVDGLATSKGHRGQTGERNAPSVYNASLHFRQFWDGRATDVEEQALGPILNPLEMALPNEAACLSTVDSIPEYKKLFKKAFPKDDEPMTYKNVGKAIGAFERTLLTPSRFDAFLQGDDQALADAELRGLITFGTLGCTTCHNGVAIGANSFQKLGLIHPFKTKDLGRYQVTKSAADKFFFKPPSLRNVAKTAPYFHDGSVKTLDQAVRLMGKHQLDLTLTQKQINEIKAFLNSLTGELPEWVKTPVEGLPESGPQTPKPDPN